MINFTVTHYRDSINRHQPVGNHVFGQYLRQVVFPNLNARRYLIGQQGKPRHHIGNQVCSAHFVGKKGRVRVINIIVLFQLKLNLLFLYPVASYFNLVIGTAQALYLAVWQYAANIAGLINFLSGSST
jgi:hypothetical protein